MKRHLVVCFTLLIATFAKPGFCQEEKSESMRVAKSGSIATLNPDAPPETQVLGQLAGEWQASQVKRNPDGSWATDTTRAEWHWYFILNGHAVQDNWVVFDEKDGTPLVVGTNIRIYNREEKQWHIAWIDKTYRRLARFTAINDDGKVVMTGQNATGRMVRNTFSGFTGQSFDWQQEWTSDEGQTWFAVTKIHCRRKP